MQTHTQYYYQLRYQCLIRNTTNVLLLPCPSYAITHVILTRTSPSLVWLTHNTFRPRWFLPGSFLWPVIQLLRWWTSLIPALSRQRQADLCESRTAKATQENPVWKYQQTRTNEQENIPYPCTVNASRHPPCFPHRPVLTGFCAPMMPRPRRTITFGAHLCAPPSGQCLDDLTNSSLDTVSNKTKHSHMRKVNMSCCISRY